MTVPEESDLVLKLADMVTELRSAMSEAHGVLKDLRRYTKEAREAVSGSVAGQIEAEVKEQLARLGKVTEEQMAKSVAKVGAEFDRLAKLYLEGAGKGAGRGENLHDLALRARGGR